MHPFFNVRIIMKKYISLSLVLLVFLASCKKEVDMSNTSDPVVRVIDISHGFGSAGSNYIGSVEPAKKADLNSKHTGTLVEIFVRQGQYVSAGQPIARIESQSISSAAEAANAALRQAEDGLRRLTQVHDAKAVADVKMVEVETKVAQARAAAASANQALSECTIRAPFSGVVSELPLERGVEVSPLDLIATVMDLSSKEIEVSIPENEISSVSIGDSARVEISAINRSLTAVVSEKSMVGTALSHTYKCRLKPLQRDSGNLMMPGMICKVFSAKSDSQQDIIIPADVVKMDSRGKYVWTVSEGVVSKKYISLGRYVRKGVVVEDGLSAGDQVIVEGMQKVSTGMHVTVTK